MTVHRALARGSYAWITPEDVAWCRRVAMRRTANSRGGHLVDHRYSAASGATIDMQGVLGEFAMCQMLDLDPRQHIDEAGENQCAATDTFDIRVLLGDAVATIDVKCVRNDAHYPLLVTAKKLVTQPRLVGQTYTRPTATRYENPATHYALCSVRNCPTPLTLPDDGGPILVAFEGSATGVQLFNHANVRLRYANKPFFEVAYDDLTPLVLSPPGSS